MLTTKKITNKTNKTPMGGDCSPSSLPALATGSKTIMLSYFRVEFTAFTISTAHKNQCVHASYSFLELLQRQRSKWVQRSGGMVF